MSKIGFDNKDIEIVQISAYKIFEDGRIYSDFHNRFLSYSKDKDGYDLVTMRKLGINKNDQYRVHRIIAMAFLGSCPEGFQVNHKDGDKSNNNRKNLEYVSCVENIRHARDNGLSKKGKLHHNTKPVRLTKNNVTKILYGSAEIKKNVFHAPSVHRVARGERKTTKGWKAEYV